MTKIFKWDGNWKTVIDNVPKNDLKYFGKPVTSENNLGVWIQGLPRNCRINDDVVKNSKNSKYGVIRNEKSNGNGSTRS